MRFVIVTGMSGGGKQTAQKMLDQFISDMEARGIEVIID